MAYDSGNVHLDRLHELFLDYTNNDEKYSTWEHDFLDNLGEQLMEFEIGDKNLTDSQKDKIDEIYREHLEE